MDTLRIDQKLESTLSHHSDKICLKFRDRVLTYAETAELAKYVIHQIESQSKEARRIAFFADHSLISYVSIFACAMTNRTFLPLPNGSSERTEKILAAADVDLIVVSPDQLNELPQAYHDKALVTEGKETLSSFQPRILSGNDLIYILFTSGSTGRPKGVPIDQENLLSFCEYNQARYQFGDQDVFSQTFALTFDLAMFNIFMAWFVGASIAIPAENELIFVDEYIRYHKITVLFCVPSLISVIHDIYQDSDLAWPMIRLSLFCGEGLRERDLAKWFAYVPNALIENLYGPTELTISCTAYVCKKGEIAEKNGVVAIGKAYPHLKTILLLSDGSIASHGRGELCVAGLQKFRGYLQNEESKTFLVDGLTYLRTGDEVEIDEQGLIFYIGRLDLQVKINGYRVELREIEKVIEDDPLTKRCICCLSRNHNQDSITAFVDSQESPAEIKKRIQPSLPAYMIPKKIIRVNHMPLNSNGKIDRKAVALMLGN